MTIQTEHEIQSEKAQSLFTEYPSLKRVYFTSDKMVFMSKREAEKHASVLRDKQVIKIEKEKCYQE